MRMEKLVAEREVRWACVRQHHANPALTSHDEWDGTTLVWRLVPSATGGTSLTFIMKVWCHQWSVALAHAQPGRFAPPYVTAIGADRFHA
jgi:hypothetical protein